MKVKRVMTVDPAAVWITDSLRTAAQTMWQNDCGILPIIKDGQIVVGLITDRDVCMGAYIKGRALQDLVVSTCMQRELRFL